MNYKEVIQRNTAVIILGIFIVVLLLGLIIRSVVSPENESNIPVLKNADQEITQQNYKLNEDTDNFVNQDNSETNSNSNTTTTGVGPGIANINTEPNIRQTIETDNSVVENTAIKQADVKRITGTIPGITDNDDVAQQLAQLEEYVDTNAGPLNIDIKNTFLFPEESFGVIGQLIRITNNDDVPYTILSPRTDIPYWDQEGYIIYPNQTYEFRLHTSKTFSFYLKENRHVATIYTNTSYIPTN